MPVFVRGIASPRKRRPFMSQLRLTLDSRNSPQMWAAAVLDKARALPKAGFELRLIETALQRRFRRVVAFADKNGLHCARIGPVAYYVLTEPSARDLQECSRNDQLTEHPVLLIPTEALEKTAILAQECGIEKHLSIISIESFIAIITIGLAMDEDKELISIFQEIVETSSKRLTEVETSLSLLIEVR